MSSPSKESTYKKEFITVSFMVEQMRNAVGVDVEALNEVDTSEQHVRESNLHRPGLALAGYIELFTYQRVQILGNTENQYLRYLSPEDRQNSFENILQFDIPCIFLTDGNTLDPQLIEMATEASIPIFRTPVPSTRFMALLRDFLADQFALQQTIHGSLVDVYGVGLLLIGKSGIGKSEVALDLVERGHRLVADDVVVATKKEENVVMGSGTELTKHFMEVRGLGLVDVRAMFGIRAIRFQKRIEVVIKMHQWDPDEEYTRLGMVDSMHDIMGVDLPLVQLPIIPGKNVTVICEVIAMNHLLMHYGYNAAELFKERLEEHIRDKGDSGIPNRGIEYFEHDYE